MRLLLPLILTVLIAACTPAHSTRDAGADPAAGQPRVRKQVTAAIFSEPPTVVPGLNPANAAGSDGLVALTNAGLSVVNRQGERIPRLAESIPTVENGLWRVLPDGRMETTWKLRNGTTWHDGTAFTSADVLLTATVRRDKDAAEFYDSSYDSVEAVEAPDPLTVVVRFSKPYIEADALLTWIMPQHLAGKPYLEEKSSFTTLALWRDQWVGLGPYHIKEWAQGSHVALEAHDGYFAGRPRIDDVVVRFYIDANALLANVMAGVVDVTLGRGLSLEQALQLQERWREGRVETAPANSVHIWPQFLNPNPAVVGDVRFRRAALHAIDRQQMIDTLEAGMTQIAYGWFRPDQPEYAAVERSIVKYDYDPRRSAQLLEELGYTRAADGMYRDAGGQKITVEIRTTESNDIQPKSMYPVADYWVRAGIDAQPMITPRQRAQDREYRAKFPGFELIRGGTNPDVLTTAELRTEANRYSGGNYPSYSNPQFDALVERYYSTIPRAERMEVANQIMRWMGEQVIVLPLFYDIEATAIANRLSGATARNQGSTQAWNVHEWDVR